MQKHLIAVLAALCFAATLPAQEYGNAAYHRDYGSTGPLNCTSYGKQSESSFSVTASVMMNVIADQYVATMGINQEGKDTKECRDNMEKRITSFRARLAKLGISAKDIYVDMVTQTKIYDYKVSSKSATEYESGVSLKKNIIIHYSNSALLDSITAAASEDQIFDLVKVDYIVTDQNTVYGQLYNEAMKVVMSKRDRYLAQNPTVKLEPAWKVMSDNYRTYYPSDLYKSYTAYESSDVNYSYSSGYVTKEQRKPQTFYYDKLHYSQFDTVVNPVVTEPAVEFTYTLTVQFDVHDDKSKAKEPSKAKRHNS